MNTPNLKNHVIFFSGGMSSFTVAHLVKERFPNDNILLYFTDTLWEDEDLYRFIYEASDKLRLPLLYHAVGLTPPQLMAKERFMYNSRVGNCSKKLKMEPAAKYFKKGIKPNIEKWYNEQYLKASIEPIVGGFAANTSVYFGIGWDEMHREEAIKKNWMPFDVQMPLIDEVIDNDETLKLYGIRRPRLYDMGFVHNNCKGRCVKAGQGHYKNLLLKDDKTFQEVKEQEIVLSEYIRYTKQPQIKSGKCKDYLFQDVYKFLSTGIKSSKIKNILESTEYLSSSRRLFGNDSKGNPINKPYSYIKTMTLNQLEKLPIQCDMWDIGGCGCFVDYGE
ncbi:phosphoadenosine phosphosulfate reductase family protein [Lysinibacillus sp. VIII_CA]|uniref:phosphoadenosine phosphosulfate reductase domain-containing protein n=1 Tax=Lysinibacillus sp. VIII_CA TaxID=3417452 RepID=UPI003CEE0FC7